MTSSRVNLKNALNAGYLSNNYSKELENPIAEAECDNSEHHAKMKKGSENCFSYGFSGAIWPHDQSEGAVERDDTRVVRAEAPDALDQHLIHHTHGAQIPAKRQPAKSQSGAEIPIRPRENNPSRINRSSVLLLLHPSPRFQPLGLSP